jgi:hypothetical protein
MRTCGLHHMRKWDRTTCASGIAPHAQVGSHHMRKWDRTACASGIAPHAQVGSHHMRKWDRTTCASGIALHAQVRFAALLHGRASTCHTASVRVASCATSAECMLASRACARRRLRFSFHPTMLDACTDLGSKWLASTCEGAALTAAIATGRECVVMVLCASLVCVHLRACAHAMCLWWWWRWW